MCNGVAMVSSPTAAGAENQVPTAAEAEAVAAAAAATAGTEETMDDGDEWEYDYYAVVPDAVPGDMTWMGAVEADAAGDEDDPWDTSRAAVVVMRYAAGMAEIHDEEEWDSDGDDGGWENDMSDDDDTDSNEVQRTPKRKWLPNISAICQPPGTGQPDTKFPAMQCRGLKWEVITNAECPGMVCAVCIVKEK